MSTSYADSAQARAWDRRFDEFGRPRPTRADFCHDYTTADLSARRDQQLAERKALAIRINAAVDQIAEFYGMKERT
ncbi:hypothetical protein ACW582_16265 [Pseudomonas chlororaphis]